MCSTCFNKYDKERIELQQNNNIFFLMIIIVIIELVVCIVSTCSRDSAVSTELLDFLLQ